MAKVTKQKLKSIVKECLIEILSEGIGDSQAQQISESTNITSFAPVNNKPMQKRQKKRQTSMLNDGPQQGVMKNQAFEENITSAVNSLTDDPIMASIFSETARTTLQEQVTAEGRNSSPSAVAQGDAAARKMAASDPSSIFGDASNKWANLAFSGLAIKE
jgi:hypothetical protein